MDIPEEEYLDIKIVDPYFKIRNSNDKLGILDVKLELKSGKIVNIELQVRETADMHQRILFYASRLVDEQVGSGENYREIKKVISIIICTDHNIIKDSESFHNKYLFYDKNNNSQLTDLLEINVIEVLKLKDEDQSDLATWMRFISMDEADKEGLDMVAKQGNIFEEAVCTYKKLTADEQLRLQLQYDEDVKRDNESVMQAAVNKAKKSGMLSKACEIATNLIQAGMDLNFISKTTGLSEYEVRQLLQNH